MQFREDGSRAKADNSAENFNILRHWAYNLLKSETSARGSFSDKQFKCLPGKAVRNRRSAASKLCDVSAGRHIDYRNVRGIVRTGRLGGFGDMCQKQAGILGKRAWARGGSLKSDVCQSVKKIGDAILDILRKRSGTGGDVIAVDVEGKTVTADAMHCQRETCRRILQRKGDYLFGLKENQPSLFEDVRLFLPAPMNREWTVSRP